MKRAELSEGLHAVVDEIGGCWETQAANCGDQPRAPCCCSHSKPRWAWTLQVQAGRCWTCVRTLPTHRQQHQATTNSAHPSSQLQLHGIAHSFVPSSLSPTQTKPPNQKQTPVTPRSHRAPAPPAQPNYREPMSFGRASLDTVHPVCAGLSGTQREPRGHLVRPSGGGPVLAWPPGYRRLTDPALGLDCRHDPPPLIHVNQKPGR